MQYRHQPETEVVFVTFQHLHSHPLNGTAFILTSLSFQTATKSYSLRSSEVSDSNGVVEGSESPLHKTNHTNKRKTRRQTKQDAESGETGDGEESPEQESPEQESPEKQDDDEVIDDEESENGVGDAANQVVVKKQDKKTIVSDKKSGKKLCGRKRKIKEETADDASTKSDSGFSDVSYSTPGDCSKRRQHPAKTVRHPKPTNADDDGLFCSKCYMHCADQSQRLVHEAACFLGRRYPCLYPSCTHANSQRSHMLQHFRTEHLGIPFRCSFCKETTTYKKSRDKHKKNVHKKVAEHPSDDEFEYEKEINEHLQQLNKGSEETQSETADQPKQLKKKNINTKKEVAKKEVTKKAVVKKAVVKKEEVFKYKCEAEGCDFVTDDKTQYTAHLAKHSGKRQRRPKEPKNQPKLQKEQQQRIKSEYECSVTTCGKVFSDENRYREHFKSQHVDNVVGEVYYCELCITRLLTEKGFEHHMNSH